MKPIEIAFMCLAVILPLGGGAILALLALKAGKPEPPKQE